MEVQSKSLESDGTDDVRVRVWSYWVHLRTGVVHKSTHDTGLVNRRG